MRPRLESLSSTDLPDIGLEDFEPEDPESFSLVIDAEIGLEGDQGADIFTFMVRTPDASMRSRVGRGPNSHLWNGHVLFVNKWSYDELRLIVGDVLSRSEASEWQGVAAKLGRHMDWEFENLRP